MGRAGELGPCLIVASYKENPKVELLAGQSADWWAYHTAEVPRRRHTKHRPARWHSKVLACRDVRASVRQVIEWYEVSWQVELFFRELKSRLQFEGYVLMKFEAVERYVDLLLMGFLLLEWERLREMKQAGVPAERGGEPWVQARTLPGSRRAALVLVPARQPGTALRSSGAESVLRGSPARPRSPRGAVGRSPRLGRRVRRGAGTP